MKRVLFVIYVLMACIALLFAHVGAVAVDEWMVHDWDSIAPQKISLLAGLASAFGVCALVSIFGLLVERMFDGMRNRDPDFTYDVDRGIAFPDSPNKPR